MGLLLSHPEVGYRTCDNCRRWYYDPDTGKVQKQWRKNPDTGRQEQVPRERKPGGKLPCWSCPKCEGSAVKGPEVGRKSELSARNWQALRFYHQQKAAGGEVDAVARKNCGLIEWLMNEHRSAQSRAMLEMLKARTP